MQPKTRDIKRSNLRVFEGHFERRISFGYDADLIHVRAEFDGEHLRVIIPRKVSPIIWREARPSSQVDAYPDAVL